MFPVLPSRFLNDVDVSQITLRADNTRKEYNQFFLRAVAGLPSLVPDVETLGIGYWSTHKYNNQILPNLVARFFLFNLDKGSLVACLASYYQGLSWWNIASGKYPAIPP